MIVDDSEQVNIENMRYDYRDNEQKALIGTGNEGRVVEEDDDSSPTTTITSRLPAVSRNIVPGFKNRRLYGKGENSNAGDHAVDSNHLQDNKLTRKETRDNDDNDGTNMEFYEELSDDLHNIDEEEHRILCMEIESIYRSSIDGISTPHDKRKKLFTSIFSNEKEISDSMHTKIVRLIMAMMPNSTAQQKKDFVRDLFDMGIRVIRTNPIHSVPKTDRLLPSRGRESNDDVRIDESNLVAETIRKGQRDGIIEWEDSNYCNRRENEKHNPSMRDQNMTSHSDTMNKRCRQREGRVSATKDCTLGYEEISLTSETKDDLIQECIETGMPSPIQIDQKRCDYQVQRQLGDVSDNTKSSLEPNNFPSTPGKRIEQRPGQADEYSIEKPTMQRKVQSSVTIEESNAVMTRNELMEDAVAPSFDEGGIFSRSIVKSAHNESIAKLNQLNGSLNQKQIMPERKLEEKVKSFRENLIQLDAHKSDDKKIINNQLIEHVQRGLNSRAIVEEADVPMKDTETANREIMKTTIVQQSKNTSNQVQPILIASGTDPNINNESKSKHKNTPTIFSAIDVQQDNSIAGSRIICENDHHSTDHNNTPSDEMNESGRSVTGYDNKTTTSVGKESIIIEINSSLTSESSSTSDTEIISHENDDGMPGNRSIPSLRIYTDPSKLECSRFESIDLSVGETIGKSFSFTSSDSKNTPPSWRLKPSESLSDFRLLVLSIATGETTDYHIHKHMMAVGPRKSEYMNEVFRSNSASTFQITLDEKTAVLIPRILDFLYCHDYEMEVKTDNAVPLRQLAKMLKIVQLEIKAATFIIEDMTISNISSYVSDCSFYKDEEVTAAVVRKCSSKIEHISASDILWIVMEPEMFHRVVTSPNIERHACGLHLSIILKEYLKLHQSQISVDMFTALTSEEIMTSIDCDAALPLIELCEFYDSAKCEALQKRCAYTIACFWKSVAQSDRRRLFSLLRNLPSSFSVDFLEIVESDKDTQEKTRAISGDRKDTKAQAINSKPDVITVQDLCKELVLREEQNIIHASTKDDGEVLSWRLDSEKSYSDWTIEVYDLDHHETKLYHIHKHIIAVGSHKSYFFRQNFLSSKEEDTAKGFTTLELDHEAASVIPQALDFVYSQGQEIDVADETALAIHYVARVLGVSTLCTYIVDFINKNMTLDNVASYIRQSNSFKDYKVTAMASQLCARNITSIGADSELLRTFEPDFFESFVSSSDNREKTKCHVNVLILKYCSLHDDLNQHATETLLKCVDINQIDHFSALELLKIMSDFTDEHKEIKIFDKMKKRCANVMTTEWTYLTKHHRKEMFLMFPDLDSEFITSVFDTVDHRYRMEYNESLSLQGELVKRYRAQVTEANRQREEEVSNLTKTLNEQTARMVSIQKEMEERLKQEDKSLIRQTLRSSVAITANAPTTPKTTEISSTAQQRSKVIRSETYNVDSIPKKQAKTKSAVGKEINNSSSSSSDATVTDDDDKDDKKSEQMESYIEENSITTIGEEEKDTQDQSISTIKAQTKTYFFNCCPLNQESS